MPDLEQSYQAYLQSRYGFSGDGLLTDFLSRRDGRLLLGDQLDVQEMVERYGTPLELSYCPLIAKQIQRMQRWASRASTMSGYRGGFVYAYATKANYSADAVRTALAAGAHYETSAAADVQSAHSLWQSGILSGERYIFCNGSKDDDYLRAITALRKAGHTRVVAILDDLAELETYLHCDLPPLMLGLRERRSLRATNAEDDRFGMTPHEITQAVARIAHTPYRLVAYHAMLE
jgi:arginine decarboxylase